MKKIILSVLLLLSFAAVSFAADIVITSVGQSPDAMMVRMVLKKMKVDADYEAMMKPEQLEAQKILIAVIGGSSKGLGAAGINKEDEMVRAKSVMEAAKAKGIKVLVMHVGGDGRRGDLTDFFIEGAVPLAEEIIVVKGGNNDGIFDKLKPSEAKIVTAEKIQETNKPIEAIIKEWGVAI